MFRSSSPVVLSGNRINTGLRRKLYLVPVFATILLVPADKYVLAGETITAPLIAPLYLLLSSAPTTTAGPSVSGTTDTTTTLSATINENGTGYYLVQEAAVAAPTIAAVLAGTSFAMSGGVAATQAISGLVALTPYKIYFVAKDATGNIQTAAQSVDVTTTAVPDITAPTTTAGPSVSGTTDTTTTLSATINENGTGYYLIHAVNYNLPAPTVAEVLAGTSFAMSGGVAATPAISGLEPSAPYKIYFVAKDAVGNIQTAVQSVDVTTTAEPDTTPNDFDFGGAVVVAVSTLTESTAITVSGINTASPISVTNGEYQIDSGEWTTISSTVSNGQTVKVRHTSSADYATSTGTNLTIGGFSDAFWTTTITANYVTQGGLSWMPITFTGDYISADTYCRDTTINGQTGWRMPTESELFSLYSSGAMNGQGWTLAASVRSSTWNSGGTAHSLVDLDDSGYIYTGDDSLTYLYVSCVRPI